MSHRDAIQKARARRGRRKRRRQPLQRMEAHNPRRRTSRRDKWAVRAAWTRKHPSRPRFGWNSLWKLKAPLKKLQGVMWWTKREDKDDGN